MRSLKPDIKTSQDLTAGALNYTTTIAKVCKLDQILFKASVAITETITITIDLKHGSNYDTVIRTINLSSSSSYRFSPEKEFNLQAGDEIKIQCTNANVTGTIFVTIKISELGG